MIIPKTCVKPSTISGLGLFADEKIKAGSLVWQHHSAVDILIEPKTWIDMPEHVMKNLLRKSWLCNETGRRWCSLDDDYRINHSENPNIICIEGGDMVAARDIEVGEEITADYRDFHEGDIWEGN